MPPSSAQYEYVPVAPGPLQIPHSSWDWLYWLYIKQLLPTHPKVYESWLLNVGIHISSAEHSLSLEQASPLVEQEPCGHQISHKSSSNSYSSKTLHSLHSSNIASLGLQLPLQSVWLVVSLQELPLSTPPKQTLFPPMSIHAPQLSSILPSQSHSPSAIPLPPHSPHSSKTLPSQSQAPSAIPSPPHSPQTSNILPSQSQVLPIYLNELIAAESVGSAGISVSTSVPT